MKLPLVLLTGISFVTTSPADLVPRQVKDINAKPEPRGSSPQFLSLIGRTVYFKAWDPIHGEELWKTNGSGDGTMLVKDIKPGPADAGIGWIAEAGKRLLFTVNDEVHGPSFWASDGTERGTTMLPKFMGSLKPGQVAGVPVSINGVVYLRVADAKETALYAWNGNPNEAMELNRPSSGSRPFRSPGRLTPSLGGVIFTSEGELWRSNGTPAGTYRLGSLKKSKVEIIAGSGENLTYLYAESQFGGELWKYTAPQQPLVSVVTPELQRGPFVSSKPGAFVLSRVFFAASDYSGGEELWESNGSSEGTKRVVDALPGPKGSMPEQITKVGNWVYFTALDFSNKRQLWRTNGDLPGATQITRFSREEQLGDLVELNGGLYFTVVEPDKGRALWRTAIPSTSATRLGLVQSIYSHSPADFTALGGQLIFNGSGLLQMEELWATNGSVGGTRLLKDLTPGTADSHAIPEASMGNTLYFQADDGEHGSELWKTDGTEAGTTMVEDLTPGLGSTRPESVTPHGKSLYFTAQDQGGNRASLWRLDPGKPMSMVMDPDDGENPAEVMQLVPLRKRLLFSVFGGEDEGIWLNGKRGRGPVQAKGKPMRPTQPWEFTEMGKFFYFAATSPAHGRELWRVERSKGTATLVADLAPGPASSDPAYFTVLGKTTFFTARDVGGQMNLWRSNGTAKGTLRVTAPSRWAAGSPGPELTVAVRKKVFFMADDGIHGRELWTSDGTALGTRMVKDIHPAGGQDAAALVVVKDVVYFPADDSVNGRELWRSDGTEEGTFMLADLMPGSEGSQILDILPVGKRVFFSAFNDTVGHELFMSDGTSAGTKLAADLLPGPDSSLPNALKKVGKKLYFNAATPGSGRELWVIDDAERGQ